MLRSLPGCRPYRGIRWNSGLAALTGDLRLGKHVRSSDVENALTNRKMTTSDIEHLHEILRLNIEEDIANEVLYHGLPHDFSLYFTASRRPQGLKLNNRALEPLIKHNPGRVFSLTDLLAKHGESVSDAVRIAVVDKLLCGENSEADDVDFSPSDTSISKAIALLNEVSNLSFSEESLSKLIEVLREKGAIAALSILKIDGLYTWLYTTKLATEKDPHVFLALSQLIFTHDRTLLRKETLGKILSYGSLMEKPDSTSALQNFVLSERPLGIKEYTDAVLEYVEEQKLDFDKKDPEALFLRMQLMETYGINKDDVDSALRKFHEYQTHEKFGIDLVQANIVKVFCYQSFKTKNETFMKIAETLVSPEGLAVSTVAQLILAKSRFSSEKSLEIYNEYINLVSKKVNPATGRSPTGVLTESLMVASLYDNDREFAQLLYEKAIVNGIISNEHEVASIKKVFKTYGDSYVEDDWKVAQPVFAEFVLECIKKA
ncbi:hypothetical protein METBIDRAFT_228448 [Metschnikowia bicuspidata var. bicuspidata NRRL YB-4993]|uniref:Uncharacterized protein n=1 Tax=Metschnikowia bicuspidata var. bicuspidata NRRL YB-4993 TaxID=869754 RepID=A0A1A0HHE8_9ASCO|nr:hypothetical protein METBIDRAFT_228448 [Metschnikowia bicuspidata var. bicuspidata NRRL YB-4993]OBA23425.1 hypothetical protein METBIDRAFT_228448 [Metschnikowia bicuspidata var. bicuspidata NRRL YB-4993]